ncbi:MAG TPA: OsmC family peroxiredoxin [Sandaracinaceae bacterium]
MATSKASATWEGTLKNGRGTMKPAHGAPLPFSAGTRFEGEPGSNPEELIGAALAGCFSMALSVGLEKAGVRAASIRTSASVKLERQGDGFEITAIDLATEVSAPGLDAAKLKELAETTKKTCPVSKALAVRTVTVEARLA